MSRCRPWRRRTLRCNIRDHDPHQAQGNRRNPARARGRFPRRPDLEGAMLLGADLKGADLRRRRLRIVDLCQADLRERSLRGRRLAGRRPHPGPARRRQLRNAMITDARFQGSNMGGEVPARTDFRGADLTRCYLNFSNLTGCNFSDAVMRGADLTRCDLTGALFVGADLTGANLSYSSFRDADLSYAMLAGAIVTDSDFQRANLQHAELATATLSGVKLVRPMLSQAHLSRTVIARCPDLSQALGLDSLSYTSPSSIDLESLRAGLSRSAGRFSGGSWGAGRQIEALREVLRRAKARLGRRELRQNAGQQACGGVELPKLPLEPVQDAGLEVELAGAPGADLQVLLDDLRLLRSEPAIEKVVEQAESLLAVGTTQLGHVSLPPISLPRFHLPRPLARGPSAASSARGGGAIAPCRRGTPESCAISS